MGRVIVVGSGIAGLTAALEASGRHEVVLVTKAGLEQSNTHEAQGGVAVVVDALSDPGSPRLGDSVAAHVRDTLTAGAGLSDADVVRVLCGEGPAAVDALLARGVAFDRDDAGRLAHGLEAAHSFARILHAGGDATGAAISSALASRVRESGVEVREHTTVVDLVLHESRVAGVRLLDGTTLESDTVVLATGGLGQLYPYTTNPAVATADGVAVALRAGAVVADLELVQFHPTALDAPGTFLVSEAVRGEGAVLLDAHDRRFMRDVHPDAELAPRDVVARAIARQMTLDGVPVRLDATALGAERLAERFPTIDVACRAHGFDWAREPVPVTPAAHYAMGGVRTDVWGRTSVPGLLAVGEVACTGAQGANRLASNSLLEGAVFGARAVRGLDEAPAPVEPDDAWAAPIAVTAAGSGSGAEVSRADLQQLMWDAAGLTRDEDGLAEAAAVLDAWRSPDVTDAKAAEDANLLLVARALVASARSRRESRGGHFRTDVPVAQGPGRHTGIRLGRDVA